jgi:two-component system response regulator PilR (NtrC family)
VKLLRALQEKTIRRVGATEETEVDVRLVAATNRPLETLVREGRLREDLFYRLNVIPIHLPALRERREDIPLLAESFLRRFSKEMGKNVVKISSEAMQRLARHGWPGNVRELENVIERAVALETQEAVLPERLPDALLADGSSPRPTPMADGFNLDQHLRAVELDLIRRALDEVGWSRTEASQRLGITPRSLRYLMRKHGLSEPVVTDKKN